MLSHTAWQIDVSIDLPVGDQPVGPELSPEISEDWLTTVMERALDAALPGQPPGQASLLVTGDATVRELNRQFRGLDEVTDVLSFSNAHPGHWGGDAEPPADRYLKQGETDPFPFPWPADEPPPLGEVVLSYSQAQRQAQDRGEPVEQEVARLIIHGVLHLAGHDHLEPEETAWMQALEEQALAGLFPERGASPGTYGEAARTRQPSIDP